MLGALCMFAAFALVGLGALRMAVRPGQDQTRLRQLRRAFHGFAAEYGMTVRTLPRGSLRAEGTFDGITVDMALEPSPRADAGWQVVLRAGDREGAPFTVRPRSVLHGTSRRTGDPDFDAACDLSGDPVVTRAVLDVPTRDRIRRFVRAGGEIVDGRATFVLSDPQAAPEPAALFRAAADQAYRVAEAIEALDHDREACLRRLGAMALRDPLSTVRADALWVLVTADPDHPQAAAALEAARLGPDGLLRGVAAWHDRDVDTLLVLADPTRNETAVHQGVLRSLHEDWGRPHLPAAIRKLLAAEDAETLVAALRAAADLPPHDRAELLAHAAASLHTLRVADDDLRGRRALDALVALVQRVTHDVPLHAAVSPALAALTGFQDRVLAEAALDGLARVGTVDAVATLREVEASTGWLGVRRRRRIQEVITLIQDRAGDVEAGRLSLADTLLDGALSPTDTDREGRLTPARPTVSEGPPRG